MAIKHPDIPVPENIRSLPMTELGYYKPWFVKADDFRVVDSQKAKRARAKEVCWICGRPFTKGPFALVGSPISAMIRVFREPPCHAECAEYAMQVCPFVLYPKSKRRTSGLEEHETLEYINSSLELKFDPANPGKYYLVEVDDFWFHEKSETIRCEEYNVIERQLWEHGVRQQSIPKPILTFDQIPADVRGTTTREEFDRKYIEASPNKIMPVKPHLLVEKKWREPPNYLFARRDHMIELGYQEALTALHHMPIAFVQQGNVFKLVAVQGFLPGNNLLVSKDGKWLGSYIPESYRLYPFRMAVDPVGNKLLSIDTDSQLIVDSNEYGSGDRNQLNNFFERGNELTSNLHSRFSNLNTIAQNIEKSKQLCEFLFEAGLLEPWKLKVRLDDSNADRNIRGLFRISEANLSALPIATLSKLHQSGALVLAYCQLLSIKHIGKLASHGHELKY